MRVRKHGGLFRHGAGLWLLKLQWGGFAGLDRFFNNAGNAHLASIAIYHALVPQFQQLIAKHDGDLAAFYAEVKALAGLASRNAIRGLPQPARDV